MIPKVLLIKKDFPLSFAFHPKLTGRVEFLIVKSLVEATDSFRDNADIAVVVLDVDLASMTSLRQLIERFRAGFRGPIIAISGLSVARLRRKFLNLGCSHEVLDMSLPDKLAEILGLG